MKEGRRLVYLGVGLILAVLGLTTPARADEISELKQLLNEQTKMLQQLQERIAQLEARQRLKERSLEEKIEEMGEVVEQKQVPAPALPDSIKWIEKI
ncbi:MAG: hypothetical protein JW837_01595, partial [Sedimentisphaerales bacterium]|nr:hypothetical protein [Sedimentisphaerales bacterium]